MKALSRTSLIVIALVLLLSVGAFFALSNGGDTPAPGNETPNGTPEAEPYAQPNELSTNTIISNSADTATVYFEQHNNTTITETINGTTYSYKDNSTRYYYANNTSNAQIEAWYNETEAFYTFQNNTTQKIHNAEILNKGTDDAKLVGYQTTGNMSDTVTRLTIRNNISLVLNETLTPLTIDEISNFNKTADPMLTTYTFEDANGHLTVNEHGQITELHTTNTTITLKYNVTQPDKPPYPENPAVNNSTTTTPTD